jgi:phosphatidylglycerophosphate synthase
MRYLSSLSDIKVCPSLVDGMICKCALPFIPRWVVPNHLTGLRFILTFFIGALLYYDIHLWALVLFALAVATDFLDGAVS